MIRPNRTPPTRGRSGRRRPLHYDRAVPFVPRSYLRNGHLMTIYGWGAPREFPQLPPPADRFVEVTSTTRVLARCHWHERPVERTTLLLLHGLNGSADAHYMRGIADKAYRRGLNVVRLNQRNCGGTEHLAPGLFHSGLTDDARHLIDELISVDGIRRIAVAGYSLGGNLAMKLAGEYGDSAPPELIAVAAVSPIMEIGPCVRALERRSNWIYEWNFVRGLKARMRRKNLLRPGLFDLSRLDAVKTVRDFDEVYTAPHFGFASAEDYYHRASAMRVAERVCVPALVISAQDDPFVPYQTFADPKIDANPSITLTLARHGGHCGFIGAGRPDDDGYWAEREIVDFVLRHDAGRPHPAATSPAPHLVSAR